VIGGTKGSGHSGKSVEVFVDGLDLAGEANATEFDGVAPMQNFGNPEIVRFALKPFDHNLVLVNKDVLF